MYFDVKKAESVGGYVVTLEFEDGSAGKVDLSKDVEEGTVFSRLRDPVYFKTLRVEYGTLLWDREKLISLLKLCTKTQQANQSTTNQRIVLSPSSTAGIVGLFSAPFWDDRC